MDRAVQNNNQALLDKLVEHFGLTRFTKDGGYILPDGRLLDLQRSDMDKRQYHRAIAALLPQEMHGACDEITIINLMAATGVIRYESRGRVHVAAEPTQTQRRKLFDIMKYSVHPYRVIASDTNGATIGDQMFQSPQAHELLHFFNQCFSGSLKEYRDDEFCVMQEHNDYVLVFRPENRIASRYSVNSGTYTTEPGFDDVLALFKKKLAKIKIRYPSIA